jgi:peptide methionine sulfoxide reductase msrA/msrB
MKATFAGGCFWCIESAFDGVEGITRTVSGYTGGHVDNPTYEEVCSGTTGHLEAVQVCYDPDRISYTDLLNIFWRSIDPTDGDGQFVDRGPQYRTALFCHDGEQKRLALESRRALEESGRFGKPIATEIRDAAAFYPAEEYHQGYHRKNAQRYEFYRSRSGRDSYVSPCPAAACTTCCPREGQTAKPPENDLRLRLTPLQYQVTQECGTEMPYRNEFWNNKREGIYVDVVSGEVLFSSRDKFDSGTGWPSFSRPLEPGNLRQRKDLGHFMVRTEVRSAGGDSHLGHVFDDGPAPTGRGTASTRRHFASYPWRTSRRRGTGST